MNEGEQMLTIQITLQYQNEKIFNAAYEFYSQKHPLRYKDIECIGYTNGVKEWHINNDGIYELTTVGYIYDEYAEMLDKNINAKLKRLRS